MKNLIIRILRYIARLISKFILYVLVRVPNIMSWSGFQIILRHTGSKVSSRVLYVYCRLFPSKLVIGLVHSIFLDEKTGSGVRLQLSKTYNGLGSNYREALLGVNNSVLGNVIVMRNNYTKKLRSKITLKKKNIKILFATRSWHFFKPLFSEINKIENCALGFNVTNYDEKYLFPKDGHVNKNKIFRNIAFSTLNNSIDLHRINDYSLLNKLESNDLKNIKDSDIVFIDWLNQNTLWATTNLPLEKKIVVRIHSYEVFSYFPLLIDFGRIDGLIFISKGMKDVFYELWGWLIPDGVQYKILQNIRSKDRLPELGDDKRISNSFRVKTLGMLQYSVDVKDLGFALDVFEELYKNDNNYKLLLGGDKLTGSTENSRKLIKRINSFPSDAVQEVGYISDISLFFSKIGFVLSTSEREGSHESIIEGIVYGCIPVIRDWPLLSPFYGAKSAFPHFPVFSKPGEMAAYIQSSKAGFKEKQSELSGTLDYYFDSKEVEKYMEFLKDILKG